MLKYLVILLDDKSTSFCHYDNNKSERRLIALDDLKAAIRYGMVENLMIQFVYPDYELPQHYKDTIETIDHIKIVPDGVSGDVVVYDKIPEKIENVESAVIRIDKAMLLSSEEELSALIGAVPRINLVITDMENLCDDDLEAYSALLNKLGEKVKAVLLKGNAAQLNLLTDRMLLTEMNNCNAGWETITVAPDGKFYVCPAFYYDGEEAVGSLAEGPDLKNPQLYKLKFAPLCRNCDAYHCRRCVWLNKKLTLEVNTPSRQQCIVAHTERNASRKLLASIREAGTYLPNVEISEIDYIDPFDENEKF